MQLYEQLLQFPLFQGMSRDDLAQVAGQTRFDFLKHPAQRTVVATDEPCTHLYFLLTGTVTATHHADDHAYALDEQLDAPAILQPEALFGYHQRYTHTFLASTPVSLLRLQRQEVLRLSSQFLVFRINLLNIFSTHAQKLGKPLWETPPATLEQRIVRFIAQRCIRPTGPKTLHIRMNTLALNIGDSRLYISRALNRLQHRGLITLHRARIEIPALERLAE